MMIVSRWLRDRSDTALTQRVIAVLDRFTPPYRRLVLAGVNTENRWAALDAMAAASPSFPLAQFTYGDELFHRGALAGKDRGEAAVRFGNAIRLRPEFAPAWQHLAWVAIAEGDSVTAKTALAQYDELGEDDDPETVITQALLGLGYAWRFDPPASAEARLQYLLAQPDIATVPDLFMGPRYLEVFDAPAGVASFGRAFVRTNRPELRTPGYVAQVVGLLAQGKTDSARTAIAQLSGASLDAEYRLVAAEFQTALVLFDSLDARAARPQLDALLGSLTTDGAASAAQRRRAVWMRTLLSRRAGAPEDRGWRALIAGEDGLRPFATLLKADSVAARNPGRAIHMTDTLLSLDSAGAAGDPFFRSALHLMRAQWQVNAGDTSAAVRSLLWHENYDLVGHFDGVVEAADADAAFGTVGRWYRALLLEAQGATGHEVCAAFDGAARLWAEGDPRYRQRAARARAARPHLACTSS